MTIQFNSFAEAQAAYREDAAQLAARGVINPFATSYMPEGFKRNYGLAMDAQPLLTTVPNSSIPAFMTTYVDPAVYEILFAPNKAAEILTERKNGDWTTQTAMFITVEHVGEVSSYGDYAENGHTGANVNFPQRQAYLFQTIKEYGDLEADRAGLAKLNWVSEIDKAAALALNKYLNYSYFFGIGNGLQNYGLLNDPNLTAALTPSVKANGGNGWLNSGGTALNATANEIFGDIQSLWLTLVNQTAGLVTAETKMTLALSPASQLAMTATNSFNVNVEDLLKKNFPNLRIVTAVQYGKTSTSNQQGIAAGNLVQLIAGNIEGQEVGFCAFNEKMRAHTLFRALSSYKQKITAGTYGAIIRQPFGIAQMLGV